MAKKNYSKAERLSFKKGMQAQYNKEHPLLRYVGYIFYQSYNEDGSKSGNGYSGKKWGFKTKKEAMEFAKSSNDVLKHSNARVLASVKAKKVNTYRSEDSTTQVAKWEKVKPFRE